MASSAADDDDAPSLGDFFISRDYTPRTFTFPPPPASGDPAVTVTLDALASAATDFDLTGQIIWVCSVVTSIFIAHAGRSLVEGEDVLELGAGCGLCGMTATRFAKRTFLSDNEPEVLTLLHTNVDKYARDSAFVADLSWGSRADEAALATLSGRARWRVICGADVVYWSHAVPLLFDSVKNLLAPDGVFILGFTNRVNGLKDAVEAAASSAGLSWTTHPLDSFLPADLPVDFGIASYADKITLYVMRFT
jgi:predicted nicotinamide N-methyase